MADFADPADDALDGAVERSLPKDMVNDWRGAPTSTTPINATTMCELHVMGA